jgi:dihydroorotate dehydrogenase electron transfer subunit
MKDGLPQPTKIAKVIEESAQVKTFVLQAAVEADPGQFIMIWLPRIDEKPFSLVNADPVAITVARVGPFTEKLHRLRIDDRIWFRGPLGRGFELRGKRILLIGGGYGVAPLAFLAQRAIGTRRRVTAVIGARSRADLVFPQRFAELGCSVVLATEDGSAGVRGLATDVAELLLEQGEADTVYACGPKAMLNKVLELCRSHGLFCQLSLENYMRCGLGVCGSCQRGGMLVCRDGPVFACGATVPPVAPVAQ